MIDFEFDKHCYGCSLCKYKCPKNAIEMAYNAEGFLIPVIDKEKCIECGLCEKICPHLNELKNNTISDEDEILAAYRKDMRNYTKYTSSGIFSELAKKFVSSGDFVAGCVWDENMKAKHIVTNDIKNIEKIAGSKYVQSDIQEIYTSVDKILKENKKVLICGTPCQIAAIKKAFNSENLYTIAIVCHGTPSPKVWEIYKQKLEEKEKSKMIDANFRYKGKYGWITPYTKYDFKNKSSVSKLSFTEDAYVIAFGEDLLHRNSCYNCKYKGTNSNADIIIGDYWGCSSKLLKKSHNKGISAVIVHTEKGKEMLELISNEFVFIKDCKENILKENNPVLNPVKYNPKREVFYEEFKRNNDIEKFNLSTNTLKYKIKKVLYKLYFFELIKRIIYKFKH